MSNIVQNRPLCLASSSPRRKMFLEKYDLQFDCHSPNINETPMSNEIAKNFVKRMANEKAQNIKQKFYNHSKDIIVLAGDTIVFFEGKILGKPENQIHAETMLYQLSGETHQVFSGFSILDSQSERILSNVVCTEVKFLNLNKKKLEWYVNSGEPFGKAGSYSIQGLGSILVESISGSYNNVVGFPIENIFPHLINIGCISFGAKKNNV